MAAEKEALSLNEGPPPSVKTALPVPRRRRPCWTGELALPRQDRSEPGRFSAMRQRLQFNRRG